MPFDHDQLCRDMAAGIARGRLRAALVYARTDDDRIRALATAIEDGASNAEELADEILRLEELQSGKR